MESLFATSSIEIAHQLAERMAVFLSERSDERKQIYRQVKRAYSLRSKVIHVDVIKDSKTPELLEISLECDELLRRTIRKAAFDEYARSALNDSSDTLDRYFLDLLFE